MNNLLKILYKVEDEEQGPSVDSEDFMERIQCRRNRIKARVENQKRMERGETDEDKNKRIDLSKSRKQIELSRTKLNKLDDDGLEFLTNVKVASDARECARRFEDDTINQKYREKMENEAKTASEKFEEITKRWDISLQKEVPQDLHEMLHQQTEACNAVLDEKNKLITDLQLRSKEKDDSYVKELKTQSDDIDLMVHRMNEQVESMSKSYRDELNEIEKSFMAQRDDLLTIQIKEWNDLLDAIKNKQIDYLEARRKRAEDNDNFISDLRASHAEEYNELKIKLEIEVQTLEQEIQMAKATFQLNLEKIEYNLQVLKKRDEENTITKSQQKRKITKLHDTLNNLKIKHSKVNKQCLTDNETLTEDYKRRMELFRELQLKSRTLLKADGKHFKDIWLMNESELQMLARKILDADKIISEQQLGLDWSSPSVEFLQNHGPINSQVDKSKSIEGGKPTNEILREFLTGEMTTQHHHHHQEDEQQQTQEAADTSHPNDTIMPTHSTTTTDNMNIYTLDPNTIRALLELLCDEGSFLVEEKLRKLLEPLDDNEASLMQLDAIFTALKIENEEDINKMLPYFIVEINDSENQTEDEIQEATLAIMKNKRFPRNLIHPTKVIKALHEFILDFYQDNAEIKKNLSTEKDDDFQLDAVDTRDDSQDTEYWSKYVNGLIDPDKELVWDALTESLDKYLNILNYRKKLLTDIEAYRAQNNELKFLLHQYLSSPANRELAVPPSKVIQYNQ